MKTRYENRIRLLMLASSLLLLLTVVIPHHHHEDGMPCIFLWDNKSADDGEEGEEDCHHSCESNGHTIAFNAKSLQNQAAGTHDLALLLIPLYTLFDYINPPLPCSFDRAFDSERTLHAQSLFSIWVVEAAGFRAPPRTTI
ncbi:MAG: hypothetical protein LBQ73_11520 [Tannerellaceae bacterium]|jgi:hypothetical protein|nr:hypothetical protein [Tannerellaceae bacterium]